MPSLAVPVVAAGALARLAQPDIQVDGLVLRPWQASDRATVVAAYADPGIRRWHCRSMNDDEARDWITAWRQRWDAESDAGWAVTTEPGHVVGQISLRHLVLAEGLAHISYWVLPDARGRRIAGRALGALSGWAFGTLGLHRLEVSHSTLNAASCRVATWSGYLAEGTKRSEALHEDGWHDMHLHARLAGDEPP